MSTAATYDEMIRYMGRFRDDYDNDTTTLDPEDRDMYRRLIDADPDYKAKLFRRFSHVTPENTPELTKKLPKEFRRFVKWFNKNIKGIRRRLRYAMMDRTFNKNETTFLYSFRILEWS